MENKIPEIFKMVEEFNNVFGIELSQTPTLLNQKESELRYQLGLEELSEYNSAVNEQDLVGVADALVDQMYILVGTIMKHGLQDKFFEMFNEVHRSNMSKLEEGKVILREDGKILKGRNYSKPDLKSILYTQENV